MNLDQLHRSGIARQDGERREAQVLSVQRERVRRFGRDRRRPFDTGVAEAVHDVPRLDARPHHDAQVRKLGADFGEIAREALLRGVQGRGSRQERVAFGHVGGSLLRAVRKPPIAGRIADGRLHVSSPASRCDLGEAFTTEGTAGV